MSHLSQAPVLILESEIDSLRKTATFFGAEVLTNTKCRWFNSFVGDAPLPVGWTAAELKDALERAPYVIRHPDAGYDIALIRNKNGKGYSLFYDSWGIDKGQVLDEKFGKGLIRLTKEYTKNVVRKAARAHGWLCQENTVKGRVTMTLVKV